MSTGSKLAKVAAAAVGATAVVAARDLTQKRHAILRTYPVIGHLRFFLERFGPELRQYIVTSNDEERPFSRDQRRWIYSSAKLENNYFGFGTDNDVEHANGYPIIKHRTFKGEGAPTSRHSGDEVHLPSAKVLGGPRGRRHAFRPASIVNISGMSFGSLSGNAIEALNRGAALAGCMHDTGEGALSPYHRNGGDLVFQIGTSYFGCRDDGGAFDLDRLKDLVAGAPVRAIEIKLSQGAKPGLGGMLPGAKVTEEIAADPRHRAGRRLRVAQPAHGVPRRRLDARLRRAGRRRDRPARGHQVGRRVDGHVGRAGRVHGRRRRARRGLRERRRRRGRHRRGAADLRRRRVLPVPGGVRAGLQEVRGGRPDRRRDVHGGRQARAYRRTPSSPSPSAWTWSTWPARR